MLFDQPILFAPPPQTAASRVWMCVLASGSSGNCTALVVERPSGRQVSLIDLGLSPRRTRGLLAELGIAIDEVRAVYLTHLDTDHWNPAWIGKLPGHTTIAIHRRHRRRAERDGAAYQRWELIDGKFVTPCGACLSTVLAAHDELGSAVFRFEFAGGKSLGFATDLGRVTQPVVDHLRSVTVLAIESNYCPRLQAASPRPEYLKRRITSGSGHLSNQQCSEGVRRIGPGEHVVLLHLSRQCNEPARAACEHANAGYALTLACQHTPSAIIPIAGAVSPALESKPTPNDSAALDPSPAASAAIV